MFFEKRRDGDLTSFHVAADETRDYVGIGLTKVNTMNIGVNMEFSKESPVLIGIALFKFVVFIGIAEVRYNGTF